MTDADLVLRNARVMTCVGESLGMIDDGAVVIERGAITWVGASREAPSGGRHLDLNGRLLTPGLVDCHTHAIFAGDRASEFAMRARGATYLEIAARGGGIAATLGPTRRATDAELVSLLDVRLAAARAGGTTTIEVKSGYDLTIDGELRLLRCMRESRAGLRIVPTLLVHLVPPERTADRDVYVREVCEQLVPRVASDALATSVDIYCDEGAYTLDEMRAVLGAAKRAGLATRAHVGQFKDLGGAELLAELGALSGDHLEQISDAGIAALAASGVVAVMLPGACVQLRSPVPPVEKFRAAGVPLAIATDLNPGSSFCETLGVQLWLATTHFGMTVEEAWLGVTRHGARALGLDNDAGVIRVGVRADLVAWNTSEPGEVPYRYGANLVDRIWVAGRDA
ncbi:MAG: imidazolonepropionase [Kofleriaceae bacterium]